jgi:hypothetical protein
MDMNENCKQCCNYCQKPDADGWIEWFGGKLPVDGNLMVEVQFSGGKIAHGLAKSFSWAHEWAPANIFKYRVKMPDDIRSLQKLLANEIGAESLEVWDSFFRGPNYIVTSKLGTINDMCEKMKEENKSKKIDSNPTIEQLARDYRNKIGHANRKLKEAEDASVSASSALSLLRDACKELGLNVSPSIDMLSE